MIDIYTKNVGGIWFGVAYKGEKVFSTNFGSKKETVLKGLCESIPSNEKFEYAERGSTFAEYVIDLLKTTYDGKEASAQVSFAMDHLSNYAQKVLKACAMIPLGYVTFYGAIAKTVGGSPRAVGRIMATNPFAPIVPCHRVVGSDFGLVGYGGGVETKREFLKREKKGFASKREIPVDGKRLVVFPVEFVFEPAKRK
jgi:O-6-methylguanine DNA methyltransferase